MPSSLHPFYCRACTLSSLHTFYCRACTHSAASLLLPSLYALRRISFYCRACTHSAASLLLPDIFHKLRTKKDTRANLEYLSANFISPPVSVRPRKDCFFFWLRPPKFCRPISAENSLPQANTKQSTQSPHHRIPTNNNIYKLNLHPTSLAPTSITLTSLARHAPLRQASLDTLRSDKHHSDTLHPTNAATNIH